MRPIVFGSKELSKGSHLSNEISRDLPSSAILEDLVCMLRDIELQKYQLRNSQILQILE